MQNCLLLGENWVVDIILPRTEDAQKLQLTIHKDKTVLDLKKMIESASKIPVASQVLINNCDGFHLPD